MDLYRPLRGVLFIYELARLLLVVGAAAGFAGLEGAGINHLFPYVVYLVPNALFPLMTLFLWLRLDLYRPYLALYIAGKTITVISAAIWVVFSVRNILGSLYAGGMDTLIILGIVCVLAFTALFSLLGGGFLWGKLRGADAPALEQGGAECG
jgi:hypothetical protein